MRIETAVILAAGKGTRLIPLTLTRPKVLLPIGGIPLLKRQVDMLMDIGIKNIIIVVNYMADAIRHFIYDAYSNHDVQFSFIDQGVPFGTAHAVEVTEEYVKPPFLVLYGDIFITKDALTKLVNALDQADAAVIAVRVPDPWNYGVFKIDSYNRILDIVEKPSPGAEPSNLINGGIYAFRDMTIFDYIRKTGISPRGEKEFTDSLKYMAMEYVVRAVPIPRHIWCDIGRPWDLLRANKIALSTTGSYIDPEAKIDSGAIIRDPVYVGKGVRICSNVHIGPYCVLGDNVYISYNSRIEDSIIMCNTKIGSDVVIRDSIVGENVVISDNVSFYSEWFSGGNIWYRINNQVVDTGVTRFGAVVGDSVYIDPSSVICPGIFIMPYRRVNGVVVDDVI